MLKKVGVGTFNIPVHNWVRYCCEFASSNLPKRPLDKALPPAQVSALMSLEHNLWTYAYMRCMAAFIFECGDKGFIHPFSNRPSLYSSKNSPSCEASSMTVVPTFTMQPSRPTHRCFYLRCIHQPWEKHVKSLARCHCTRPAVYDGSFVSGCFKIPWNWDTLPWCGFLDPELQLILPEV